ncbi:putative uncharacterized protein [Prevotella sp. CAG:1058]|jgi:hypothetical protein|nr:putative uncharacterized protein [Prevotella sp. CAG:1058]
MEKMENYNTLHEIRLRKELILSEIRRDNQQINVLWKELFRKPEQNRKKGFTMASLMTTGAGLADGFMLAWKLYRKFKK